MNPVEVANQLQAVDASAALHSFMAYGIVLTCVALCGLAGLRTKFFGAIVSFAAFVASSIATFTFCEQVGNLGGACGVPADWRLAFGFTTVFIVFFALLKLLLSAVARTEVMTYSTLVDRVGGLFVGALAGLFMASIVRVGLATTPVSAPVRPAPEQLMGDVTPRMLQLMSRVMSSESAVRQAWLKGVAGHRFEGKTEPGEVTLSEPFIDDNDNDLHDRDEPFLDKDGDGGFTESLTVINDARNPDFRVGVIDRYWLGNWRRVKVEVR